MNIHPVKFQQSTEDFGGVYIKTVTQLNLDVGESYTADDHYILGFALLGEGKLEGYGNYQQENVLVLTEGAKVTANSWTTLILLQLKNGESLLNSQCTYNVNDPMYHKEFFQNFIDDNDVPRDLFLHSSTLYAYLMELKHSSKCKSGYSINVQASIDYINENYAFIENIEHLSEIIGVSKHHLIREFSREVGTSPGKYLESIRLSRGATLLKHTNYSLDAIGNMVGYSNGNYFGKVFKKLFDKTPTQFRELYSTKPATTEEEDQLKELDDMYLF